MAVSDQEEKDLIKKNKEILLKDGSILRIHLLILKKKRFLNVQNVR